MFFIDIAVPRDVDPALNDVEGCFVYDLDDLQQSATSNQASRSREARAAETIVSDEVERYRRRQEERGSVAAIRALQQEAEHLCQSEIARTEARLQRDGAALSAAQVAAVAAMTRSLMGKLLHPQLTALRGRADQVAGEDQTSGSMHRSRETSSDDPTF